MKRKLFKLTVVIFFAFWSTTTQAQTNEFTYQGKLTDAGAAANGQYDLKFGLFDAPGSPRGLNASCNGIVSGGAEALCDNVQVTNGIFTVNLSFIPDVFADGTPRFLEISVRPGASTGAYTTLSPRQQITSSPFSIKSLSATQADTLSSACVLCVTDGKIQSIDGSKVTGTVANATTAANVSGIVPITNGGTGSSTQTFVDIFSSQTIFGNKNFVQPTTFFDLTANKVTISNNFLFPVTITQALNVGTTVTAQQFSGSGAGLTDVPGTFKWQTVSGLTQQSERNTGYIPTNDAQVTITLPQNLAVGEIVRVSGAGIGGWKIAQNDGQTIIGAGITLTPPVWTPRDNSRGWTSIASSANGTKLVAVVSNGQIYTSNNSGESWTANESNRGWRSVASSADGTKLVAVISGGHIWTSDNSGGSWIQRDSSRVWTSVASSADGTKLIASQTGGFNPDTQQIEPGKIFTSTNSGQTWLQQNVNGTQWTAVASSADGVKLVAAQYGGQLFTSDNSGVSWTPRISGQFQAAASSADGTKLVVAGDTTQIRLSNDSGNSWTPSESVRIWNGLASSVDGTRLAAVTDGGKIYFSVDSGASWIALENNRNWSSVAMSADGTKVVATVRNGQIYTATIPLHFAKTTTPGTAGYLTGGQYSSIELQYIGSGKFLPISSVGAITGF